MRQLAIMVFTFPLLCLTFAPNAYAYLDPGSGSLVIQFLIAAVVGAMFTVKVFWRNVKTFLSRFVPGRDRHG